MPSTAQPSPETDEKKSRGLGSYVVWAFVAVIAYVLSSGPAIRLTLKGFVSVSVVHTAYWPIDWACRDVHLRKALGMYWHLWCPEIYDKSGAVEQWTGASRSVNGAPDTEHILNTEYFALP